MVTDWLKTYKGGVRTKAEHRKNIDYFTAWLDKDMELVIHSDLLAYISYLRSNHLKSQTINNRLKSIDYYYRFLVKHEIIAQHPGYNLRVKKEQKRLKKLFTKEELTQLYTAYHKQYPSTDNYKVILSLVVNQAVNPTTIKALQIGDIDIESGSIYLPQTKRSNARTLPLKGHQLMLLYKYTVGKSKESKVITQALNPLMTKLVKRLNKLEDLSINKVSSMEQLRTSVIVEWLKSQGLRHTQYWCGHRYISSTEAYSKYNTDKLQEGIKKYHPMGG